MSIYDTYCKLSNVSDLDRAHLVQKGIESFKPTAQGAEHQYVPKKGPNSDRYDRLSAHGLPDPRGKVVSFDKEEGRGMQHSALKTGSVYDRYYKIASPVAKGETSEVSVSPKKDTFKTQKDFRKGMQDAAGRFGRAQVKSENALAIMKSGSIYDRYYKLVNG